MSEREVLDDPNVREDVARVCEAWAESSDRHVFPLRAAALRDLAAEIRTSPSRQSILEEAAKVAERGCLVPPDGGSPTEAEREMCEAIAAAIRSLSPEGKAPAKEGDERHGHGWTRRAGPSPKEPPPFLKPLDGAP